MSRSPARRHRRSAHAVVLAGILIASAGGGAGCGNSDTETSVYLEIYDNAMVSAATEVTLEILDPMGTRTIGTLNRTLPSQTSPTQMLGSVVILPGASASLGALRIKGQRLLAGALRSEGIIDVALETNRQVTARLMLTGAGTTVDAGAVDSGGDSGAARDVGTPPVDTGTPPTDAGTPRADAGTPPADAGTPATDAGTPATDAGTDAGGTLLSNGSPCQSGTACTSGFCADGFCCNTACTDLCHACNLLGARGTCRTFPAGSQCVPASCTASDSLIPARTCDGNGNCGAAAPPVSCGNYRCQSDVCLRSCSNSNACVSSSRCSNNRCQ